MAKTETTITIWNYMTTEYGVQGCVRIIVGCAIGALIGGYIMFEQENKYKMIKENGENEK